MSVTIFSLRSSKIKNLISSSNHFPHKQFLHVGKAILRGKFFITEIVEFFVEFSLDSVSQIVMNEPFVHLPKVKYSVSKLFLLFVLSGCTYVLAFQDQYTLPK